VQKLGRNMDESLRMIKALQISAKKGVAMRANRPDNEPVKDGIITPAAADEETAKERT
jgi:alkyl hydroperoxide reductase subunit AhpC